MFYHGGCVAGCRLCEPPGRSEGMRSHKILKASGSEMLFQAFFTRHIYKKHRMLWIMKATMSILIPLFDLSGTSEQNGGCSPVPSQLRLLSTSNVPKYLVNNTPSMLYLDKFRESYNSGADTCRIWIGLCTLGSKMPYLGKMMVLSNWWKSDMDPSRILLVKRVKGGY